MGRCMPVLILSFTIFLLLFSIIIPSINSIECYDYIDWNDQYTRTIKQCKEHQQCNIYMDNGFGHCADYDEENQEKPGACVAYGNFICYCSTNLCNDPNNPQWKEWQECRGDNEHKTYYRIKGLAMCYYKSETDLKSGEVTKTVGMMNNQHCQSLNIPQGQKCTRKFDNDHGHGPLKDIIECCCEEENCNDILDKDLPAMAKEPLKCAPFPESKEKYCDTTHTDPICWYQEKQDMATQESPSRTGQCVEKTKHNACNTIADNTCKRSNDENTAITTVDCCCKQNECNTPDGLASQLAMQPIPLRCYEFTSSFDKHVKKWCNRDEICLYQEKLQMTPGGTISVHGHCVKNDPNICKADINTCNRMPRDKDGISQMDCCCDSAFCNDPKEQKKYYQPPKETKCFKNISDHNASDSQWCMNDNQICLLQSKQELGIADTVITWKGECIEKENSDKTSKKQVCHKDANNKCIRSINKDHQDKTFSQVDCCCDTENCNSLKNANFIIPKLDVHKCMTFKHGEKAVSKFCKETDEICWYELEQQLGQSELQDMEQGGCKKDDKNSTGCTRLTPDHQHNKDLKNSQVECYCKEDDCNSRSKQKINETYPIDVIKCFTKTKDGKTGTSKYCKFKGDVCQYKSTQTLSMQEYGNLQEEGECVEKCPLGIMNGACNRQTDKDNSITTVECCCNHGHDCNDPAKLKDKIPPVPALPTEEELDTAAPEETMAAAATRVQLKVVACVGLLIAIAQRL